MFHSTIFVHWSQRASLAVSRKGTVSPRASLLHHTLLTYTQAHARDFQGTNKDNVGVKFSVCQQCFDIWREQITDMSALVDVTEDFFFPALLSEREVKQHFHLQSRSPSWAEFNGSMAVVQIARPYLYKCTTLECGVMSTAYYLVSYMVKGGVISDSDNKQVWLSKNTKNNKNVESTFIKVRVYLINIQIVSRNKSFKKNKEVDIINRPCGQTSQISSL